MLEEIYCSVCGFGELVQDIGHEAYYVCSNCNSNYIITIKDSEMAIQANIDPTYI